MQRRAAIEACSDVRGWHPWVPSAVEPADWGTREGLGPTLQAVRSCRGIRLSLAAPSMLLVGCEQAPFQGAVERHFSEQLYKCKMRLVRWEERVYSKYRFTCDDGVIRVRALMQSGRVCWVLILVVLSEGQCWVPGDKGEWVQFSLAEFVASCLTYHPADVSITFVGVTLASDALPSSGILSSIMSDPSMLKTIQVCSNRVSRFEWLRAIPLNRARATPSSVFLADGGVTRPSPSSSQSFSPADLEWACGQVTDHAAAALRAVPNSGPRARSPAVR
jgi:hypothetical protein